MPIIQLSKNVKRLRKSLGFTQKEVAARLSINQRTFSKFERGEKKSVDIVFLNTLAKVLETDLISLIKVEEKNSSEVMADLYTNGFQVLYRAMELLQQSHTDMLQEIKALAQRIDPAYTVTAAPVSLPGAATTA